MSKKISVAILGSGSRGCAFGQEVQNDNERYELSAVCDINPKQLAKAKKLFSLSDEQIFSDEESFFSEKRADLMVIATHDKYHARQCVRAMKMGYDVFMEKPISDSREEIYDLLKTQKETGKVVMVCHELRYGPAFNKLHDLIIDNVIGEVVAIDAMERVAYWHQAQAYVRIQSEVNDVAHPTILAKCSHDLDLLHYYAGAECDTVSSVGGLKFFRIQNAPKDSTERCLECPHVDTCAFSAKRIYIDRWKERGCPEFVWPFNKVTLKIPTDEQALYEGLRNTCFGKCVFRCGVESNKHVVDHQLVQMMFKNGVAATLKMVFAGEAGRRINIFGTHGELLLDERNETIEVYRYGEKKEVIEFKTLMENGHSHGGGDVLIIKDLYSVLNGGGEGRTSLMDSIEAHLMGISAEESRLNGGITVKVHE